MPCKKIFSSIFFFELFLTQQFKSFILHIFADTQPRISLLCLLWCIGKNWRLQNLVKKNPESVTRWHDQFSPDQIMSWEISARSNFWKNNFKKSLSDNQNSLLWNGSFFSKIHHTFVSFEFLPDQGKLYFQRGNIYCWDISLRRFHRVGSDRVSWCNRKPTLSEII